jgi:Protein of unknown function (DUF3489)
MPSNQRRSEALTDTHLVILSSAAQRKDRLAIRPERMAAGTFTKAARQLLARGFVEEATAGAGEAGQRAGTRPSPALRITTAGLEAFGIAPEPENAAPRGAEPPAKQRRRTAHKRPDERNPEPAAPLEPADAALSNDRSAQHRPGTKRALIIALLSREQGASSAELIAATGWLPHTTRAALTGLRQHGCSIARFQRADGMTAYRIVSAGPEVA